ncbi:MAG: hypothetical protein AMJ79_01780 [Phycisphaerae bacterium SM23_30]|nr:MAG: hypothetical protein AMJ79_01780 [Phycisphaerae bacterium SM23_30]
MYRKSFLKTVGLWAILTLFLALVSAPAQAQTAADIVGAWEFKMDMGGQEIFAEAVFTKNPDGTLAGKWTSSRGEVDLYNIQLINGNLTFDRKVSFGDQQIILNFIGKLQDGKIVGDFVTDMGEFPATGIRKAPPVNIVGEWEYTMQFAGRGQRAQRQRAQPAQQIPPTKIVFTKNPDGTYAGKWSGGMGRGQRGGQRVGMQETALSDIKLEGNKLAFVRKMQFQDREFSMTFEGTVEGDTIKGNMTITMMGQGQPVPATLTRVKPPAALGDWEISMTFGEREMTSTLTISQNPDGTLAGKWVMGQRGESPLLDVKFENGKLTFSQKRTMRGEETVSTFEGTIEGDILTGAMKTGDREIPIKGKRAGTPTPPAPPTAAAAKVETAAAALVGTWELTTETQRGARTNNLVINADMTGTYTQRDNPINIQDLKIEGDQVSFKIVQSRGGQETTREFKFKLEGKTLTGEYTTGRGTTKITGKKIK